MDLDQVSGTTTAFYTLHSCDGDIAMAISEILRLGTEEKNEEWQLLLESRPSLLVRRDVLDGGGLMQAGPTHTHTQARARTHARTHVRSRR